MDPPLQPPHTFVVALLDFGPDRLKVFGSRPTAAWTREDCGAGGSFFEKASTIDGCHKQRFTTWVAGGKEKWPTARSALRMALLNWSRTSCGGEGTETQTGTESVEG